MSMVRRNTVEINDVDTELNFLREAVDKNLDKDDFNEKLESKFKMENNRFSDVARNIIPTSKVDNIINDDGKKSKIDNIL